MGRILARIRFNVASTCGVHVSQDHCFQRVGAGITYLRVHVKRLPFRDSTTRTPIADTRVHQHGEDLESFLMQESAAADASVQRKRAQARAEYAGSARRQK
jgi:hypothetical protein